MKRLFHISIGTKVSGTRFFPLHKSRSGREGGRGEREGMGTTPFIALHFRKPIQRSYVRILLKFPTLQTHLVTSSTKTYPPRGCISVGNFINSALSDIT